MEADSDPICQLCVTYMISDTGDGRDEMFARSLSSIRETAQEGGVGRDHDFLSNVGKSDKQ